MCLGIHLAINASLYSPYIPENKNTDFNVSFWAGLSSNLITGIVTGIIVGLFIWWFQSRTLNKQIEIQCEREVNVFLLQLRYSYESSNANIISNESVKTIPSNINQSIELILKQPLDYWSGNLKEKYTTEVNLLIGLSEKYYKFKKTASSLDSTVHHHMLISFNKLNYQYFIGSAYGILNDYDIEKLIIWQQVPFLSDERIQEIRKILNYEDVKDLASEYTRTRSEFLATAEALETIIR